MFPASFGRRTIVRPNARLTMILCNTRIMTAIARAQNPEDPSTPPPEEVISEPAPPELPLPSCTYKGAYSIKPNAITCGVYSKYLSYIYPRCDALRVNLLSKRQLSQKPLRAVWYLDGANKNGTETPTGIKSYGRRSCPARYLQDVPGTMLRLGILRSEFIIRPTGDNVADCNSDVRIFSTIDQKYLAMDDSCGAFKLIDDAADPGASFKLIKLVV